MGWTQHHCYWNYSLHPNSNQYVFCSTGLADILFSALFNSLSHNLPSPPQGHNTPFSGYQWDISAPLPPHGLCRQYLNCIHIFSGAQEWRYIDDILFPSRNYFTHSLVTYTYKRIIKVDNLFPRTYCKLHISIGKPRAAPSLALSRNRYWLVFVLCVLSTQNVNTKTTSFNPFWVWQATYSPLTKFT